MRWIIILILGAVGTFLVSNITGIQTIGQDTKETAYCSKVVDGDTIVVKIGLDEYKVRYIGIDTPETVDPNRPVGYFGKEASQKNTELVLGRDVRLEKDVSDTDKYGRLLRYVYVGDVMINKELLRLGYAKVATYPPDVKYVTVFLNAEREARDNGRGLWSE
jgi:micrococcal nuclease